MSRKRNIKLVLSLLIDVPVPIQKSERSCIRVLTVYNLPLSTFWVFDFEIFAPVWYFLFYYEHEGISHVHTLYNLLCFTHIVLYSV